MYFYFINKINLLNGWFIYLCLLFHLFIYTFLHIVFTSSSDTTFTLFKEVSVIASDGVVIMSPPPKQSHLWTDRRIDGWTDRWTGGWRDRGMYGRMNGWTEGRKDRWTERCTDRQTRPVYKYKNCNKYSDSWGMAKSYPHDQIIHRDPSITILNNHHHHHPPSTPLLPSW